MGLQDLINVQFADATSYPAEIGADVLGIVMPFHWGPCDGLQRFNRQTFFDTFPESLPPGLSLPNSNYYDAYGQVKSFFYKGGAEVEIYRPIMGNKYLGTVIGDYFIGTKYPGSVPAALLPVNATACKLTVTQEEDSNHQPTGVWDVTLKVTVNTASVTIESYRGQVSDPTAVVDGITTFLPNLVSSSLILGCHRTSEITGQYTDLGDTDASLIAALDTTTLGTDASTSPLKPGYDALADSELSNATLIISAVQTNMFDSTLLNISANRMDCNAVIGFPIASTFTKANIQTALNDTKTLTSKMFGAFVAAREYIKLFGRDVLNNGVGGFCGKTVSVAKSVRINQLASARRYGGYPGVLAATLNFSEVLDLHEQGCISIYTSAIGPQIFGVRSIYSNQQSYYGKFNICRVLASLLSGVFPEVLNAIHTDVAANPVTRASLSTALNSLIDGFVSNQNLKGDSYADLSDELNTDALTQGGKYLNILLSLHFIGLTEKVNIRVVATDSSVTAEII